MKSENGAPIAEFLVPSVQWVPAMVKQQKTLALLTRNRLLEIANQLVDVGHRLRRPRPLPLQVRFPMAGPKDGWTRLAKNLETEIAGDLIEAYRGTVSLPFEPGKLQAGSGEDRG